MICGWATAKPNLSPARLYDLLSVRVTITRSFSATRPRQFVVAKSAYASSTMRGQGRAAASVATFAGGITVPVGLLGFGKNASCSRSFAAVKAEPSVQSLSKSTVSDSAP
jgi:hypothetical protein